jgi:pimeloyl-ACP methyl ester carboxylesterase
VVTPKGHPGWAWRFDPNLYTGMDFPNRAEMLSQIEAPITYIYGEQSLVATPEVIGWLRNAKPLCDIIGIPDCAHHVLMDRPQELTALLEEHAA